MKIAVVYGSETGNTEAMANAVFWLQCHSFHLRAADPLTDIRYQFFWEEVPDRSATAV